MKKVLLLLVAVLVTSCNQNAKTNQIENFETESAAKTESAEDFDWLTGNWKRSNEEAGKQTFENWEKISPSEYSGIGFTMQKSDTISQETMKLIKMDGNWKLLVKTPDEKEPIEFKMLELKRTNEFTCVNDSIDFPKRIQYWTEGDKLKAKISNDEMNIPFEFEKIK